MQMRFTESTTPFLGRIEDHADMAGFAATRRSANAAHQRRVTEAARLFADVLTGALDPVFLREAMNPRNETLVAHLVETYPDLYPRSGPMALRETMSVTDYQSLFADVLDRVYYGFYNAFPIVNKAIVRSHPLTDFRQRKIYMLDGAVTPLTNMDAAAPAPEKSLSGPVPQDGSTFPTTNTAAVEYAPALWQSSTATNWRAFINDDLGIFRDLARRLAIQGNRGISKYITGLFFQASGLNTGLFAAGYRNLITTAYGASVNNPPLSAQGLQDAWKVIAAQRDSSGDPIMVTGKPYLVYGPALKATAENLKSSTRSMISVEGGTANAQGFPSQFVEAANWAMQNMELIMDPYMPIVMSSASGNIANTAWALVMDPQAQDRPCVEVGFLKGYETPQIYERVPNTQRLGGGLEPMMGDFDSMDSRMKIVTVFAGTQVDGRSVVGSTGAGA